MADDKKKSAYETSSDHWAISKFHRDEEAALSADNLISAEADFVAQNSWDKSPNRKKSKMAWEMAKGQPERFLELVSFLPHVIQDIFYQYFLLGRTQDQIGETLGLRQKQVWQALELGVDGIANIAAGKGPSEEIMKFRTDASQREDLVVEEPTDLGKFILRTDEPGVEEHFSPGTPDGPAC